MNLAAKALIATGTLLVVLGPLAWAGLRLGRLPGDFRVERPGFTFYFPVATMALLSLLATAAFYLIGRLRR
ncbi:MAG: DUF2905 domain-containing protein [Armatimonadota bacterium]|nr:DUF2905 domain-containing protein [Armatimonadota bacterium]